MERKQKIVVLWLMTMCGFVCHTIMDLLPLFWGQRIAISDSGAAPQSMLLMMSVLSLLIPVCGIFCVLSCRTGKWKKVVNVALATLIALFNIVHACMELPSDNAAQYVVMPMLIIIGICLAWHSYKLLKSEQ